MVRLDEKTMAMVDEKGTEDGKIPEAARHKGERRICLVEKNNRRQESTENNAT